MAVLVIVCNICEPNQHIVHLKVNVLYVNYICRKLESVFVKNFLKSMVFRNEGTTSGAEVRAPGVAQV